MTKRIARFILASLIAVNGIPAFTASNVAPTTRQTVLQEWANAVGMSGDLAGQDEITSIEYWGTGTLTLNGQSCALTDYHASIKYQVPGMRVEFTCTDATGQAHHEIQVVADRMAWNEGEPGTGSTSAMTALDQRLTQLWTGPLALVKAAAAAGAQTRISAEAGKTVVTFPVPGVADATVKATLNASHQAEQVDTRLGRETIQTRYADYAKLDGVDFRFDTFFPHHIVQTDGAVTLVDLTVTRTRTSNVDLVFMSPDRPAGPSTATPPAEPPVPPAPASWKDKKSWAKLDASLQSTIARGCVTPPSVIIRTEPGSRAGVRESLTQRGDVVSGDFPSINALSVRASCADLQVLASVDATLSMSVNARVTTESVALSNVQVDTTPVSPSREAEGRAAAAQQTPMLQTLLGDNFTSLRAQQGGGGSIGVAVIDSGIETGPDFGNRISAFYDFTNGDIRATAPMDAYGHGTHVAGLVASRFVGVAPQVHLIGLRVLDAQGQGSADSVMRAIEFAIVNKDSLNIQILNLSLGHPIYEAAASDPMVQEVERAVRAGLVVVLSAGNFGLNPATGLPGYGGIASPGNAPSAYSIGAVRTFNTATRDDDRIAAFSSRGPTRYDGFVKPDFSAPGQNILSVAAKGSTLRLAQEARGNSGNYMRLNGTSMAAGIASGVAALALQANPDLTPNALKAVLEYSAIDVKADGGQSADFVTQGVGAISGGAVALAQSIDARARIGTPRLLAALAGATTISGETMPWVERIMWGTSLATGVNLMSVQQQAWNPGVTWGSSLDDNIVWGNSLFDDNIVWGNALFGDNIVWGNSLSGDNIVWGNSLGGDNIVWGNSLSGDNIVWGNSADLSDTDVMVAPPDDEVAPAGAVITVTAGGTN